MIELEGLTISPYSDRSKWVLKHHAIPYKYTEHLLIFGIPALRLKLRKYFGDVTVPALIDGDTRMMNSFDIAQYLDALGTSEKLFPPGAFEKIKKIDELSEKVCDAGRAIVTYKVSKDREAQLELLPPFIPDFLKRPLISLAFVGTEYIKKSFSLDTKTVSEHETDLRNALIEIRNLLVDKNFQYFLDHFSYADITVACCLQMVKPAANTFLDKTAATRRIWTQENLADEFADILAWRDKIFALHHTKSKALK